MYEYKMVDFSKCRECENWGKPESEEPCYECLQHGTNLHSQTPINFKKAKKKEDQNEGKKRKKSMRRMCKG